MELDLLDILFFVLQQFINSADVLVGQCLNFICIFMVFVLGYFIIFFGMFQIIHGVATDIANRDAGIFGVFVGDFCKFNTAFFGQEWEP